MELKPPFSSLCLWCFRVLSLCTLLYLLLSFLGFKYSCFIIILVPFMFAYLLLFFRGYRALLLEKHIELNYGVLIKHHKRINRENIICTTLFKLPDAGCLGLQGAILRGVNTRIFILELRESDSQRLIR